MSRIRQIKPSWFLDKELRRGTTADAREFYIGLWMLADDAGYLVWDVERIGAELYPFEPIARRERNVARWADVLERLNADDPHLIVWTCGHARVPKMPGHQRIAGTQTTTVRKAHSGDPEKMLRPEKAACEHPRSRLSLQVATDGVANSSHGIGRVGNGKGTVGNGTSGASAPEGAPPDQSEFDAAIAAAGGVGFRPVLGKA